MEPVLTPLFDGLKWVVNQWSDMGEQLVGKGEDKQEGVVVVVGPGRVIKCYRAEQRVNAWWMVSRAGISAPSAVAR